MSELVVLTLDVLGGFGALKPLEEQDEDLFPVLRDGLTVTKQREPVQLLLCKVSLGDKGVTDSRRHVLDDAVEEVKTLVVVGFGSNELLENSQQARLWEDQTQDGQHTGSRRTE